MRRDLFVHEDRCQEADGERYPIARTNFHRVHTNAVGVAQPGEYLVAAVPVQLETAEAETMPLKQLGEKIVRQWPRGEDTLHVEDDAICLCRTDRDGKGPAAFTLSEE